MDLEKESRILELRAMGKSYATIANELKIGKQTAIDVCRRYREKLSTLEAVALERLYEEQRITATERITAIASLMKKEREEIERRDLSAVPTEKLIDLYLKSASALKSEIIEPDFRSKEEQDRDREEREYLDRISSTNKTDPRPIRDR